jgi:hypothetical protein
MFQIHAFHIMQQGLPLRDADALPTWSRTLLQHQTIPFPFSIALTSQIQSA